MSKTKNFYPYFSHENLQFMRNAKLSCNVPESFKSFLLKAYIPSGKKDIDRAIYACLVMEFCKRAGRYTFSFSEPEIEKANELMEKGQVARIDFSLNDSDFDLLYNITNRSFRSMKAQAAYALVCIVIWMQRNAYKKFSINPEFKLNYHKNG